MPERTTGPGDSPYNSALKNIFWFVGESNEWRPLAVLIKDGKRYTGGKN